MCNEQVKSAALEGAHRLFAVGLLYPNATKSQTSEEAEEVVANTMLDALGAFIGTPTADDEERAREIAEEIKRDWYAWCRGEIREGDLNGERFIRLSTRSNPDSVLTEIIAEHLSVALTRSRSDLDEKWTIRLLRDAGCKCLTPLLGERPDSSPRCRLCNVEYVKPSNIIARIEARRDEWNLRLNQSNDYARGWANGKNDAVSEILALLREGK